MMEGQSSGSPSDSESTGKRSLNVSVSTPVEVTESEIEILSNTHDIQEVVSEDQEYTCEVGSHAGTVFNYKVKGNKLTLAANGHSETYDRVSASEGIYGAWRMVDNDGDFPSVSVLEFSEGALKISQSCYY